MEDKKTKKENLKKQQEQLDAFIKNLALIISKYGNKILNKEKVKNE